jgi:hypothetical protein
MSGDLDYTREKYGTAVRILATGDSPLRDRLWDAYASSAERAYPPKSGGGTEMSTELEKRVIAFHERMTSTEAPADRIRATVDGMTDDQLREAANDMVDILDTINRELRP